MMRKQLIVAVEGTAAMGPYWKTIISDYLEKMIRSFTEADSIEQNPSAGDAELLLVVFNVHGPYSACVLQRTGWTRDIDMFFQLLSAVPFSGGGFNAAAVAEGLAEALMMFSPLNGTETQQNADGQRHCILVAASNPHPLPTLVYDPVKQKQSGDVEAHARMRLADAETVAKAFPQCSVSLSVICPKKLPKLREIYNAGKRDPEAADPPVDTSKNPNFLVLISENFSEACAAFSRTEMGSLVPNQSLVETDMSFVPPVSEPATTSNPSVMNQEPISAGNNPDVTVNMDSIMVTSVSGPAPPQSPTAHPTSQIAASLQSTSPTSVSEEMVLNNENTKETTPIVSVMTQSLGPFSAADANVRILNGVASAIPAAPAVLTSEQLGVTSMMGFAPFAGTGQKASAFVPASLTSTAPSMSGNSNLCMAQLWSNIQGGIGVGSQTATVMSQENLPGSQMIQSGLDIHQNVKSGIDTGMPFGIGVMIPTPGMHQNVPSGMGTGMSSGIDTMMPTPGMTQQGQPGILPLGRNNSAEANMSLSEQQTLAPLPSAQSNYVKIWEGTLSRQREGEHVLISRLQGFRKASASESLAANWPSTMEIFCFSSKEQMNEHIRQRTGKADFIIFWAMDRHALLNQLQERNLCAVISLPSQTMFLSVSDRTCRLIGMLFPRENIRLRPRVPNQQLQEQLLPQLQQQQPHCLQLKEPLPPSILQQQPLSLLQQQQHLQELPQQQTPRPLKRQHNAPLQQQSKVPTLYRQQTPQTQQIEQQQPIIETIVNQASSQGVPSTPEEALLIELDNESDNKPTA